MDSITHIVLGAAVGELVAWGGEYAMRIL